jgi:hypothetical protein
MKFYVTFRFTSFINFFRTSLKSNRTSSYSYNIYTLGAQYCTQKIQEGGACSFVQNILPLTTINLDCFCIDKDNEVLARQLILPF